ncbi:hypothetical protein ACSSS7_003772 [Eimeria intestinalis]
MHACATALSLVRGAPLLQQRVLHAAADTGDACNATQLALIIYAFGKLLQQQQRHQQGQQQQQQQQQQRHLMGMGGRVVGGAS